MRRHLNDRLTMFERDRAAGVGTVYLPDGLARKYPKAAGEWSWHEARMRCFRALRNSNPTFRAVFESRGACELRVR